MKIKLFRYLRLFLESLDIFAVKPADIFTFKNSFYYSTASTKVFSLIVGFLAIFFFVYSVRDIYYHTNPDIHFYESYTKDPSLINFGMENNYIAFGLEDTLNGTLILDPTLFEIEMSLYNNNNIIQTFELEVCDKNNKTQNFRTFLDQIQNPQFLYCLKNYSALQLQGTWGSQDFIYVDLWIRPCNETKRGIICKSTSQMDDILKKSSFVMKYGTISLDPFDYDTPLKQIVADYFSPLNNLILPEIFINFAKLHIQDKTTMSNMKWFQPDENIRSGILFSSEKYSMRQRTNSTDPLFHMNLRLEKIEKTVLRKYETWIDVLSKVGGFLSFLKIALNIMLIRFVRAALIQRVSNEIFDYKNIVAELVAENPIALQKIHSRFKIKMSFWTYIKSLCWCISFNSNNSNSLSHEAKIIESALKQMIESLDISKILNCIFEVEKVEQVLPENQARMLGFLAKPKLKIHSTASMAQNKEDSNYSKKNLKFSELPTPSKIKMEKNMEELEMVIKQKNTRSLVIPKYDEDNDGDHENVSNKEIKSIDFKLKYFDDGSEEKKDNSRFQNVFFPKKAEVKLEMEKFEKNVEIAEEDLHENSAEPISRKEKIINEFLTDVAHFYELDKTTK